MPWVLADVAYAVRRVVWLVVASGNNRLICKGLLGMNFISNVLRISENVVVAISDVVEGWSVLVFEYFDIDLFGTDDIKFSVFGEGFFNALTGIFGGDFSSILVSIFGDGGEFGTPGV